MAASATLLTRIAGIVSMVGLFLIAVLTVIDVSLRWLFNAPIHGQADITEVLLPIIIAAAFVSSAWGRPHVGIRFLGSMLGANVKKILDFVSDILLAVFLTLIVWQFWNYATEVAEENRQTWVLGIPLYPFWYATAAILFLTAMLQFYNAVVLLKNPPNVASVEQSVNEEDLNGA